MNQQNTYGYLKTFSSLDTNEQVAQDFRQAQMHALWNRLAAIVLRKRGLVNFEQATGGDRITAMHEIGVRQVSLDEIQGSVGRSEDFDGGFMPLQNHTRSRWQQVDRAYREGRALPPVDLYQLGNAYFVIDGHHRLSVAALHGQRFIEARVIRIELECKVQVKVKMELPVNLNFGVCSA